jgi:hypothetical protein
MTPNPGLAWNALMRFCRLAMCFEDAVTSPLMMSGAIEDFLDVIREQLLRFPELREHDSFLALTLNLLKGAEQPPELRRVDAEPVERLRLEPSVARRVRCSANGTQILQQPQMIFKGRRDRLFERFVFACFKAIHRVRIKRALQVRHLDGASHPRL